ncbi:MAG: type I methionyl aminopeptidase [Elusimicrobia bacterium]|nr:type I methionyl aminopeptidase [Elusimicrobiota bacterium]
MHSFQPPVIELKTKLEIDIMREAGRAVARILQILFTKLEPGVTTGELDKIALQEIRSLGMKPAFLGYRGYPATACISINEELVHGIPRNDRRICAGDIVTVDMGVIHNGYYGDAAATFPVGVVSAEARELLQVTKDSLDSAIACVKPGNRLGDVSRAIQDCAEQKGYAVVRDYVGHGIGRKLHEEPPVPNFGKPHTGPRLVPGMVLAIEPMVNCGGYQVKTLADEWTVVTVDGRLCAHFEHMVAVTDEGCEVLTVL